MGTTIYTDSSLEEACFIIGDEAPVLVQHPKDITVNEGEYKAIIFALTEARRRKLKDFILLTDSQFCTRQIQGDYVCKAPHLRPLRNQARDLLPNLNQIKWIPREENKAGKVLERRINVFRDHRY
jgi:ribonuclease HI